MRRHSKQDLSRLISAMSVGIVGAVASHPATARIATDWGIKPYSTLFGALKVADEVEIVLDTGPLPI